MDTGQDQTGDRDGAKPAGLAGRLSALAVGTLAALLAMAGQAWAGSPVDPEIGPSWRTDWRGRLHYCEGGNCLAHGRRWMPSADRASFRPLNDAWALDHRHVWYRGREVDGADPAGWRQLGPHHGADGVHAYARGHRLPGIDPRSVRYLPRHYVIDASGVHYVELDGAQPVLKPLHGADPASFALLESIGDTVARDHRHLYLGSRRLPVLLADDFRPLWRSLGISLAFINGGRLHVSGRAFVPEADSLASRVPIEGDPAEGWVIYPGIADFSGSAIWGLAGGFMVQARGGDLVVVQSGVSGFERLEEAAFVVVADGVLRHRNPNTGEGAVLGPVAADFAELGQGYFRNAGRIYMNGKLVDGADATTFRAHPRDRDGGDASDGQRRYSLGRPLPDDRPRR